MPSELPESSRVGNLPVERDRLNRRVCRVEALVAEPVASWLMAQDADRRDEMVMGALTLMMAADADDRAIAITSGITAGLAGASPSEMDDPLGNFLVSSYRDDWLRGGVERAIARAVARYERGRGALIARLPRREAQLPEIEAVWRRTFEKYQSGESRIG